MKYAAKYMLFGAVMIASAAGPAMAADFYEPPVAEMPPVYQAPEYVPEPVSGWYLRGDIGYSFHKFRGSEYYTWTPCGTCLTVGANDLTGKLKGSLTYGAGVGYKAGNYFRGDVTVDYFNTTFNGSTTDGILTSSDTATFNALTVMANAYVDFGTYGKVTPYAGLGIGGAAVDWGDLQNTICTGGTCTTTSHHGNADWRFAWAVMAGASVDLTCHLAADVGYRFRRIEAGGMFGYADHAGPGYDRGINSHEVRAGLRYKFGQCAQPTQVVYQPEPLPPVYK